MKTYSDNLTLTSYGDRVTYHEITEQIKKILAASNIQEGLCVVSSPHTTCSVIFEEKSYDESVYGYDYLQLDLNNLLEKLVPDCKAHSQYFHPGPDYIKVGLEDFKGSISPEAFAMYIQEGLCVVSSPHTKCSVIFEEKSYDESVYGYDYLQLDLNNLLEKLVPDCKAHSQYFHPGPDHIKVGLEDFKGSISPEAFAM